MTHTAAVDRRTCLGIALGLAADAAFPHATHAPDGNVAADAIYKSIPAFGTPQGRLPQGVILGRDGLLRGTAYYGGEHDQGTLYRMDARRHVQVLHSFGGGRDAARHPTGTPTEDENGDLYGLTYEGGEADGGVAYRFGSDGRWDILHHFGVTQEDGTGCYDGLLLASDGQLYGSTRWGGEHGGGLIFRLGKDGALTPLWQLGLPGEPETPVAALMEGADGRLYGTSWGGGELMDGTVYSLAKDGSDRRVLHSFARLEGDGPTAALIQGTDGFLYGTSEIGGAHSSGTVFRLSTDGSGHTVLHDFRGEADGASPNAPLLEVQPGVFMGTASLKGSHGTYFGGTLFVLTSDGGFRVRHRFGRRDYRDVPDGQIPTGALCPLPSGELVGTCRVGGDADGGTLWFVRAPHA